jgi:hypothetical protein
MQIINTFQNPVQKKIIQIKIDLFRHAMAKSLAGTNQASRASGAIAIEDRSEAQRRLQMI